MSSRKVGGLVFADMLGGWWVRCIDGNVVMSGLKILDLI